MDKIKYSKPEMKIILFMYRTTLLDGSPDDPESQGEEGGGTPSRRFVFDEEE